MDRLAVLLVFKSGFRVFGPAIALSYANKDGQNGPRVAFVVSKKVAKTAVERNKIRRRCYASVFPFLSRVKSSFLLVFSVKNVLVTADRQKLTQEIERLLKKAGAL